MSDRKRYEKKKMSCSGKLKYKDEAQAQLEIDRAALYRGETLRAYHCGKCGKVHLSSMSPEDYQRFK